MKVMENLKKMDERSKLYLEEEKPVIEFPTLITIGTIFISLCLALSVLFLPWYLSLSLFLGLCLAVAIFFNLYIGILVFLVGAFLHPTQWIPALRDFNPALFLAFGVLFIWGIHALIFRDFQLVKAPQNLVLIGFLALAFISTFNIYSDISFDSFFQIGSRAFVLYFAVVNLIKKRNQIISFYWFLVIIGLVLALIGIYQYTHHIGNLYEGEQILRVSGVAADANVFALDLTMIVPVAIGLFFGSSRKLSKIFIAAVVFLIVVTIIFTYSRAGFLQLGTVLLFSVGLKFFRKNRFLTIIISLSLIMMLIQLVPPAYWQRIQTMNKFDDPAVQARLVGWASGIGMAFENPIKGVGFGVFRYAFIDYAMAHGYFGQPSYTLPLEAHNLYIQTAAEVGLLGLIFFMMLVWLTFRDINKSKEIFLAKQDKFMWEVSNATQIALIAYLIGGLFISYIHLIIFWILVPFAVAIKQFSLATDGDCLKGPHA